MAERVNLEQNTPEWEDYRYDHCNASEAGTVMRCNKFQTIEQLRKIKETRQSDFKGNAATEYGHKHEESARVRVEELLGATLKDCVFRDGIYSASLDAFGVDGNETIKVEIKCPYGREDSYLWKRMQEDNKPWDQKIPEYYVWQIVHQHMVMPTARTYFFVFIPGETWEQDKFELVECFVTDDQVEQLKAGWEAFLNPEEGEQEINDDEAILAVYERAKLKYEIAKLQDKLGEIEADLKRRSAGRPTVFGKELSYKPFVRKGTIDAKALYADGIDADKYRKADTKYWKFGEVK